MTDTRQRWEERYATRPAADEPPSEFLAAHAQLVHGRVLDVAAGAGRNALFLARRGCRVDAFDIAYGGLHILRARAAAEGLDVRTVQCDLEHFPLPEATYDAVLNFRYLQRSLFGPLQRALVPGGVLIFETFLVDQRTVGHPSNPAHLLERGELRVAFSNCEILTHEEGRFGDAFVARLIARRRKWD